MYNVKKTSFPLIFQQEDLKGGEQPTTQQKQEYRSSPTTTEEVQWSYTDPQGKVQGKLSVLAVRNQMVHGVAHVIL